MTAEKSNQYYAKLQDIYEQAPVLIDIHSLLVTPSGTSNDSPRRLLAAWGQNLISFLLLEIIRKYPVLNMDMLSCKENEYFQKVSSFIESYIDSKSLFFNPHGSVDESLVNGKLNFPILLQPEMKSLSRSISSFPGLSRQYFYLKQPNGVFYISYQWNGSSDWFLENFYCFPGRLPGNCWKLL